MDFAQLTTIIAVIALMGNFVLLILFSRERSQRKSFDLAFETNLNKLAENTAEKIKKDPDFEKALDKLTAKKARNLLRRLAAEIVRFILSEIRNMMKDHMFTFKFDILLEKVDQKIKDELNSIDQEEDKTSTQQTG